MTKRQPCPSERALIDLGIAYTRKRDGSLHVKGDIYLNGKGLIALPDLSRVHVKGSFHCDRNELTSLKGSPASVSATFWCAHNKLTTLEGAPEIVGGCFYCDNNLLTSLKGCPQRVGNDFSCDDNPHLRSLIGGPAHIGMAYYCRDLQLQSLYGIAHKAMQFVTDFGSFDRYAQIPSDLLAPHANDFALQKPIRVVSPLKLKRMI